MILPLFFFINTFFLFFIYLEFSAVFIFFLFTVSKTWNFKNFTNSLKLNLLQFKAINISYLNLLFFQFWSSFFSSVIIVFVFLIFLNIFCSLEWTLINYLNYFYCIGTSNYVLNNLIFFFFFFIIRFICKNGIYTCSFF